MAKHSKATNIQAEVRQSVFEKQMQIWAAADESFHTAMAANFRLLEMKIAEMRIVPSLGEYALEAWVDGQVQVVDRRKYVGELIDVAVARGGDRHA